MKINPRYRAYCEAHSKTVEAMKAHDVKRWPGGKMCGFVLWVQESLLEWRRSTGWEGALSDGHQDAFSAWLVKKALISKKALR